MARECLSDDGAGPNNTWWLTQEEEDWRLEKLSGEDLDAAKSAVATWTATSLSQADVGRTSSCSEGGGRWARVEVRRLEESSFGRRSMARVEVVGPHGEVGGLVLMQADQEFALSSIRRALLKAVNGANTVILLSEWRTPHWEDKWYLFNGATRSGDETLMLCIASVLLYLSWL